MKPKIPEVNPIFFIISLGYLVVSILHFGIFFYNLDKLINNIFIGLIILTISYILKKIENLEYSFQSIDKNLNDVENSLIKTKTIYSSF